MSSTEPTVNYKIIILGGAGAGKTCLLKRAVSNKFSEDVVPTIGATFMSLEDGHNRYEFWDTAGAEQFRSIVKSYYRGCHIALLAVDLTSESKFSDADYYIEEYRKIVGSDNHRIFLVATKNDREDDHQTNLDELKAWAVKNKIDTVLVTSSKNDTLTICSYYSQANSWSSQPEAVNVRPGMIDVLRQAVAQIPLQDEQDNNEFNDVDFNDNSLNTIESPSRGCCKS